MDLRILWWTVGCLVWLNMAVLSVLAWRHRQAFERASGVFRTAELCAVISGVFALLCAGLLNASWGVVIFLVMGVTVPLVAGCHIAGSLTNMSGKET